jgi:hypothetical protein
MTEDPAQGKWMIMQAVRLAGVVQVVLGILVITGKIDWPAVIGYVLAGNGLLDVFVIPLVLAKRWKSPLP